MKYHNKYQRFKHLKRRKQMNNETTQMDGAKKNPMNPAMDR